MEVLAGKNPGSLDGGCSGSRRQAGVDAKTKLVAAGTRTLVPVGGGQREARRPLGR